MLNVIKLVGFVLACVILGHVLTFLFTVLQYAIPLSLAFLVWDYHQSKDWPAERAASFADSNWSSWQKAKHPVLKRGWSVLIGFRGFSNPLYDKQIKTHQSLLS